MDSHLKILIVDDSPLVAPRVRALLDRLEPTMIIGECINADEALDLMQEVVPDAVLLDLNLHGKSGLRLLKEIKLKYPQVIVIVFTNHAEPYCRDVCKQLGADYFFDKTSEFEMLPTALQQIA